MFRGGVPLNSQNKTNSELEEQVKTVEGLTVEHLD